VLVSDTEGIRQVASVCAAEGRFAVDSEADSLHSYFHKVCLVQVSAGNTHWVIDPLAVSADDLKPLWRVLADPMHTVVMHGADYDIRVFDRDYAARVRGLEDTQIMAQLLGEEKTGLAALLENEFGLTLDKKHQRADWGRRPLPRDLLAYAVADTAHLVRLADRLRSRLDDLGRWTWAVEEFGRLEEVRYEPPSEDPLAFERLKGARSLRGGDRDRLSALHGWREGEARRRDLPPFKVLGNRSLLELAVQNPSSMEELVEVPGLGRRFARKWGRRVLRVLAEPRPAPPRPSRGSVQRPPAETRDRIKSMVEVRDRVAEELGLKPGLVAPRALVQCLAEAPPTPEGLTAAGLVGWRRDLLAERFIVALGDPA
jgi:ribonuclease D